MSLVPQTLKLIYQSNDTDYSNNDLGWVQFVRDHYTYLRNKSTPKIMSSVDMSITKYRIHEILAEMGMSPSVIWIVLLINQLPSENDFVDLTAILIPDMATIEQLHSTYNSIKSNTSSPLLR